MRFSSSKLFGRSSINIPFVWFWIICFKCRNHKTNQSLGTFFFLPLFYQQHLHLLFLFIFAFYLFTCYSFMPYFTALTVSDYILLEFCVLFHPLFCVLFSILIVSFIIRACKDIIYIMSNLYNEWELNM